MSETGEPPSPGSSASEPPTIEPPTIEPPTIELAPVDPASSSPPRRRWPMVAGILVGLVAIIGIAAFFGSRALYSGTFGNLVDVTQSAEGAPVWGTFFVAQDCFIDAVVESGDVELAFNDGLRLLDETDLLARHVTQSLTSFLDVSILPWHGALAQAREAIVAHYEIWDSHLREASAVLGVLSPDPELLAGQFQAWVAVVVDDSEGIQSSFEAAGELFRAAAADDADLGVVATLFTPSDAECTRGAV